MGKPKSAQQLRMSATLPFKLPALVHVEEATGKLLPCARRGSLEIRLCFAQEPPGRRLRIPFLPNSWLFASQLQGVTAEDRQGGGETPPFFLPAGQEKRTEASRQKPHPALFPESRIAIYFLSKNWRSHPVEKEAAVTSRSSFAQKLCSSYAFLTHSSASGVKAWTWE